MQLNWDSAGAGTAECWGLVSYLSSSASGVKSADAGAAEKERFALTVPDPRHQHSAIVGVCVLERRSWCKRWGAEYGTKWGKGNIKQQCIA